MYRVVVSFSGQIVGRKSEIINIKDKSIANDLLRAGYIEKVSSSSSPTKPNKQTKKKKK